MTPLKPSPNDLDPKELTAHLGQQGIFQLLELQGWLETLNLQKPEWRAGIIPNRHAPVLNARFAPSIIARSEAELFGVSLPRFAIRVFLGAEGSSFVNARRTALFADQSRSWGKRRDIPTTQQLEGVRSLKARECLPDNRFRMARNCPGWILHSNSCIGDSLLQKPTRYDGYKVLERPLGLLYGELDSEGLPLKGTPYIRHIPLSGGGLCAQAVCFMATLIQYEHAKAVYGIAEITKLASQADLREIPITGLLIPAIRSYFTNVGLETASQLASSGEDFRRALCSYVRSDVPVILPVDAGRWAGASGNEKLTEESICKTNGLAEASPSEKIRTRPHATLVVGHLEDDFLIHDPLLFPYMKANFRQLYEVGPYSKATTASEVVRGMMLAVVPPLVKLALLENLEPLKKRMRLSQLGLFSIDAKLRESGVLYGLKTSVDQGKFILCKLSDVPSVLKTELVPRSFPDSITEEIQLFIERQLKFRPENHWCWIQHTDDNSYHTYVVWDAELSGPKRNAFVGKHGLRYVLGAFICENAQWKCIHESTDARRPKPPPAVPLPELRHRRKVNLKPSLISSFSMRGYEKSFSVWPNPYVACELYTFMQADERQISSAWRRLKQHGSSLLHWLRYTEMVHRHNIARRLPFLKAFHLPTWLKVHKRVPIRWDRQFRYPWTWPKTPITVSLAKCTKSDLQRMAKSITEKAGSPIIGLASYLPELTSSIDAQRKHGTSALCRLVELAAMLREKHPIRVIETVGGSLVDGIWPGIDQADKGTARTTFVANILSDEAAFSRLAAALQEPADLARSKGIQIALELEPGPLFILRDLDTLSRFAKQHLCTEPLRSAIGYNLDVGHWILSGATPEKVKAYPEITERICHGHIS